jgi:uncharacterized protein with GYD domain
MKFLIQASYTAEGAKGLLHGGGTARRKAVEDMLAGVGGKMEAFYFCFGEHDAAIIADMPDHVAASAVALAVAASGVVRTQTTVLVTPEEVDQATKMKTAYRPPQ